MIKSLCKAQHANAMGSGGMLPQESNALRLHLGTFWSFCQYFIAKRLLRYMHIAGYDNAATVAIIIFYIAMSSSRCLPLSHQATGEDYFNPLSQISHISGSYAS